MELKRNKIYVILIFFSVCFSHAFADSIPDYINKQTVVFAQRDTSTLRMDIYRMRGTENEIQPVMLFVFGGAFKTGWRDQAGYNGYFTALVESGITTISIDYRLGLVDRKISLFNTSAADDAINMAVEDLYSATNYVIQHANALKIDTACIMVSGSSAGAVTSLHADYILKNDMPLSEMLPTGFTYKGILSFAGAIFSHKGTPDYKRPPAPTLFMHGNKDKVVQYNKLRLFRKGLFGSKSLAARFKKRRYNYFFLTYEDRSHSIAIVPILQNLDIVLWFIQEYVFEQKNWQLDANLKDKDAPVEKSGSLWGTVN